MSEDGRHLTLATLDQMWSSGQPIELPMLGTPECRLRLDPQHRTIQLVTAYQEPEPDVSKLRHIGFDARATDDGPVAELTVQVEGAVHGAYGLMTTVVDELQVAGAPLAAAVAAAVMKHRSIFASRNALTVEKEIGLYGELLLLEYMISGIGAEAAVATWQGPLSEEHDFVLDPMHFEVKTTSGERRKHVIHGLTQLVPLRGVPLSLLSIQLTRASAGGGRTLPQLISDVRRKAGGHVVELDRRMCAHDWDAEDADLYRTVWTLRSAPRAYVVQGDFPAMTPERIEPAVPNFHLVSEVSYKIDVTDRSPDVMPSPIDGFVQTSDEENA